MAQRLIAWLLKQLVELAAVVGLAVIVSVVWLLWQTPEKPVKSEPAAEAAEVGAVKVEQAATACICGTGVMCTGPRGGSYCLTESGNKRYKQ